MDSEIISVTIQSTILNGISSILAQALSIYKTKDLSNIDVTSFVQFILYTIFISPPNYLWQKLLEDSFPSKIPAKTKAKPEPESTEIKKSGSTTPHRENDEQFSLTNTAFKFILDQTAGAVVNTVLFICLLDTFKGTTYSQMKSHVMEDFWPLLSASYTFWPFVSLLNYTVIPFNQRALVGSLAGLAWGVYLNLTAL